MTVNNPFDALFAFACRIRDETLHRHSVTVAGKSPEPPFFEYAKLRLDELDRLIDAAVVARQAAGFGMDDLYRRLDALATPLRKLIRWEVDGNSIVTDPKVEFMPEFRPSFSPYIFYHSHALSAAMEDIARMAKECNPRGQSTPVADPEGDPAKRLDESAQRRRTEKPLRPAVVKASDAFDAVQRKAERKLQDQEAYNILKEEGIPEEANLADYRLPTFDTWARYLRQARQRLGGQKYTPRRGRAHGKSIVGQDEI